jgi:hypothetical protein
MRFLLGWALKLSLVGVVYVAISSGFRVKLPEEVLGYKVPESAQRLVDRTSEIANIGEKTQSGFKAIGDSFK